MTAVLQLLQWDSEHPGLLLHYGPFVWKNPREYVLLSQKGKRCQNMVLVRVSTLPVKPKMFIQNSGSSGKIVFLF